MSLKRKEKLKRWQRAGIYGGPKTGAPRKSYDLDQRSPSASRVEDLPPNENFRKYPDEVCGDAEIPQRGKLLTALRR